jgi:ATP-dependent exoDNAse (exonuclease V) beta subunit
VRAHEHLSPWPRLTGLFIHAGLEAFIKETPFAPDMVWEELLHREAPELHASPEYHAERHTAATLLGSLLDSDLWKNLLSDCLSRDAELAFVHRTSEGLVHGVMDLLLDKGEKGLFVVDYKTNAPSADLRAWCETHGYDAQIRAYVEAVRVMHPNRPVTGLILAINQQPTLLAL